MNLFRDEVVNPRHQTHHGRILLTRPLSFSFFTAFFATVSIIIILFFSLCSFTRKETVHGVLLPSQGLIGIYASQGGILVERKAREGQEVKEGDELFVLSNDRFSSAKGDTQVAVGDMLSQRVERLKYELQDQQIQAAQQHTALERKRTDLASQLEQMNDEIGLQRSRAKLADDAAHRFSSLQKENFVSLAQVQEKAAESLDQQSRLRALERAKANLNLDLAAVDADILDQPLRTKREASTIERTISEIEQNIAENAALQRTVIRAPKSGVLTAITYEQGQSVVANAPMATIIPSGGELEAQLFATSRAIGFVKPGTQVLMRYPAFPYQKFGQHTGTVMEVSRTAIPPQEIAKIFSNSEASTEPLFRISVKLDADVVEADGVRQPLKSGMQLDASILLEHRKLYEWLVEPLKSVTGRI